MYVYGQLIRAAVETLGADPSTVADKFTGRLWYNTATNLLKYSDASNAVIEFVTPTATQTLTNKTLTSPIMATIVNGAGTLTLPSSTDTLVGRDTTDTLTNKTLTAPVISTISNSGTLTLPTGPETLVGRATTDTLTNKTLTSPLIDVAHLDGQGSAPATPASGFYKLYVSDTTQKLTLLDSSGATSTVGSGSSGINYLSANYDAEAGTTGWVTYADAAGTSPVDGTGGSPASTFTRTTSSPLAGTGSFLWTKSAANRQGEGFSYDFTIDSAYKGQQLAINYLLEVTSGTFVTADMTVWVYDVTNAVLTQPSAYQVVNTAIAGPVQTAVFQAASNSTSYRLIFHTATTSALAYSLKFDNFSVGPQIVPVGAALSDWVSFTPTGSWVANATYTGRYRRVGDTAEFHYSIALSGAPTGTLTLNMPAGISIDTTKLSASTGSTGLPGSVVNILDGGTQDYGGAVVMYVSATSVGPRYMGVSGANGLANSVGATSPITFGNTDTVTVSFSAPIVGWASNTVTSDSAASRVVAMTATSGATNSFTGTVQLTGFTATFDTHGGFASNAYTVKVPGKYSVSATALSGAAAASKQINIYKNGVFAVRGYLSGGATASGSGSCHGILDLVAGDILTVYGVNGGASEAWSVFDFNVALLQGPAQIQAATIVAATYAGVAAVTSYSGAQIFKQVTKLFDTTNSYDTATGLFTCPAPGIYEVNSKFNSNSSGPHWQYVGKNGSTELYRLGFSTAVGMDGQGSALVECVQGDTLGVYASDAFDVSGGGNSYSFVNFKRISGVN